jgi:uncharacterized protein (DUF2336 family)
MTDSAAWQEGNAGFASAGATPSDANSVISANSFRALTAKLKKPGTTAPASLQSPASPIIPSVSVYEAQTVVAEIAPQFAPSVEPSFAPAPVEQKSRLVEPLVLQAAPAHVEPIAVAPAFAEPVFAPPVLAAPDLAKPADFELSAPQILAPVVQAPELSPPSLSAPVLQAPEFIAPEISAPATAFAQSDFAPSTFHVEAQKPIGAAALLQDDDDIEASVLESMAAGPEVVITNPQIEPSVMTAPDAEIIVTESLPQFSAPQAIELTVAPSIEEKFIPIESPAQPKIDISDVRRREATFAELDLIARMVYTKPSVEDRQVYLKEVAELDEAERFASQPLSRVSASPSHSAGETELAPVPVLPPEEFKAGAAEDVPFLSDDLANSFDPDAGKLHASPEAVAEPVDLVAPEADLEFAQSAVPAPTQQAQAASRLLPKVTAPSHPISGSGDVEAHGELMNDQEAGELARTLLDMMASSTSGGLPQERALAADTLLRLYPRVPVKPLMMLSERLAIMDNPPNLLVGKVIRDPRIEISGPLLENSPHVPDQELLDVIAENDPAKLRLIARRRKLTRAISDRLVQVNDPSVHLTLVRNSSAEISHNGFLALTEAARTETDIMAPLTTRADISPPFAFELFWMAPAQLRRYILNRFLTDSETLNKILKITMATQGQTELTGDTNPVIASVLEALQLAIAGKVPEAAEMITGPVRICKAAAERILNDQLGEPLAVMLKAIGFPRNDVVQLFNMLRSSDLGLVDESRDPEDLLAIFDKLSFNKARILLTYWDWAATRSGPYAPIH